jgi:hypothetical protein
VETVLVRVWVPDRPGALGQVASRIGAVHGDVIGIEILERGAGRAIDELVVALPEPGLLELLVSEIDQVDGVDVEDVRVLGGPHDPGLLALTSAARLVEAPDAEGVLTVLCQDTVDGFEGDWAVALRLDPPASVVEIGDAPSPAWVGAFVLGSTHLDLATGDGGRPDDIVWSRLPVSGLALAAGRKGRPFRWRERQQLAALARIADAVITTR